MILSECDATHSNMVNNRQGGLNCLQTAQSQVVWNGWLGSGLSNDTLTLHPGGAVNYLFVDTHVEALQPYSTEVIGPAGSPAAPQGIWTVAAGD